MVCVLYRSSYGFFSLVQWSLHIVRYWNGFLFCARRVERNHRPRRRRKDYFVSEGNPMNGRGRVLPIFFLKAARGLCLVLLFERRVFTGRLSNGGCEVIDAEPPAGCAATEAGFSHVYFLEFSVELREEPDFLALAAYVCIGNRPRTGASWSCGGAFWWFVKAEGEGAGNRGSLSLCQSRAGC